MSAPTQAPEQFLDYEKSLACIHCGLCLSSCPTYLETGDENDSPRGRIYLMRAVQDGRLALGDTAVTHIDRCLGCRACEAVCPSGVQYGNLLEHTRDHIEKKITRSPFQQFLRRVAIEKVFPNRRLMQLALLPARFTKWTGAEKILPKFAREALSLVPDDMQAGDLPEFSPAAGAPSTVSARNEKMPATSRGGARRSGLVGFIRGCVMDVMFGPTNANSVRLLNAAGYDVVVPPSQGCCGALHAHNGNLAQAHDAARTNIVAFEKLELDAIIINAAGCGSTLKEYGHLLADDPAWVERGEKFSAKVKDITEFLVSNWTDFPSALRTPHSALRVTYHDACHLAHAQRITKPPRELVKAVAGNNFVELPEADVCCGSAGTYNLTEPEMAEQLQRRKTENLLRTNADLVVTSNPGCLLQIRAGLKKAGSPMRAMHIADFLVENLRSNSAAD
ncbi:MAG: 4Fe-4S dicluster domain-containing protein [Pedosphaera sp.]|nr:4Fe-4S dicluster domain-containing protein [Pedosphaera sp.]